MSWPDLVIAYIAGVRDDFGVTAAIDAPAVFDGDFIRVGKATGSDDTIYDSAVLDFDVFTDDYLTTAPLAERLRQWVLSTQNRIVGGVQVGQVRTATGPFYLDWGNPKVSRFVYSARISTALQ